MRPLALFAMLAALVAPAAASGQASPSPYTSAIRYDAMGRVTGTISADPDGTGGNPFIAVRNSYDGAGRLVRVETGTLSAWQSESVAAASWTGFSADRTIETSYDSMSRKTRDTLREGTAGAVRSVTQYSYDATGRLECTAVRMNPAAFASLPASACTPSTYDPAKGYDRITRTLYDAAGQLARGERQDRASRSTIRAFESATGRGNGTAANLSAAAQAFTASAAGLRDDGSNGYVANGNTAAQFVADGYSADTLAHGAVGGRTITANVEHAFFTDSSRLGWAIGHDSLHNAGLRDQRYNGVTAYRFGSDAQRAAWGDIRRNDPGAAMRNPDNLLDFEQ